MRVKFLVFVLKRKCSAEDNVLELSIVLFFLLALSLMTLKQITLMHSNTLILDILDIFLLRFGVKHVNFDELITDKITGKNSKTQKLKFIYI